MATMKVTLIGLNQFLHNQDDDLFKNLNVPEGIDKDTLTGNILLRGSDFEVMYADPYFMQDAIGLWSRKWYRTFSKWVDALAIEYNPLENYDRKEDWTDTGNRGLKTSGRKDSGNTRTFDNQDKRTLDTQDKETIDTKNERTLDTENKRTLDTEQELTLDTQNERTLNTNETTERQVSAYDASTYQPAEKSITDNTGTDTMNNTGTETTTNTGTDTMNNTGTDTMENSGTDTMDHTGTDTVDYSGTITDEYGEGVSGSETENKKDVHDGRIHGNIGVTTSQQMLEAELQIAEWNLYEHITDLFLSEFIIPIYS